jgi:hypothetical protein
VGSCFIVPRRRWGVREATGGSGVLIIVGFQGVNGEEKTGWRLFSGGLRAARRCFDLALRPRRRAAVGGAGHRRWQLCQTKEGDDPLSGPSWAGVATLSGL